MASKVNFNWLIVGLSVSTIVLAFLVGFSSSPLTGVAITGALTLLAAIFGFTKSAGVISRLTNEVKNRYLNILGKLFCFLSLLFLAGIFLGIKVRDESTKVSPVLIWDDNDNPANSYEAIDWILVSEYLKRKGLTVMQIKSIYQMRDSHYYNREYPYIRLFEWDEKLIDKYSNQLFLEPWVAPSFR